MTSDADRLNPIQPPEILGVEIDEDGVAWLKSRSLPILNKDNPVWIGKSRIPKDEVAGLVAEFGYAEGRRSDNASANESQTEEEENS